MKLSLSGIRDTGAWKKAGIALPSYDVETVTAKAIAAPRWVHFGIGNIFRIFLGSIADRLLSEGLLDRGVTCVESFDYDVVDQIYRPHDNLSLSVILKGDGTRDLRVLGCFSEAIKACCADAKEWDRLKEVFASPDLQLISFTITEKGYALRQGDGSYLGYVASDMENGPDKAVGAMGIVCAMLYQRYLAGGQPVALVSMDNVSHNGSLLKESVVTMAKEWNRRGFLEDAFLDYVQNEEKVAFLWTMIDKITPRPSDAICADLTALGVEDMDPVITGKRTYIAPFANAEGPQYLVIEDRFPNGRPELDRGPGVYLADRETVNKAERMKVTVCLNPVHSAVGPLGVVLGIEQFADELDDPDLLKMARMVAYTEGLPVVSDPKIISPQAFVDELFEDRFPNKYLGDTNLRLATDVTQGFSVRFGETIKSYVARDGSASALVAIPLGIASVLRYFMAIDDEGHPYELAPDPLADDLNAALSTVRLGHPEDLTDQLRPFLSNEKYFGIDLYEAGVGEKIEGMIREMVAGTGATRATIHKYMA